MHQTSLTKNDIKEYSITWGGLALIEFLVTERNNIGTKFKTCLDIGSGEGVHTSILRHAGLEVFQVDKYSTTSEYKVDFIEHKFDRKFDVVFCSHVIEHQRNVGLFLDKIFDILSDDGVLIISAPKEDHNLIEGHLNSFIFPLFLQQMIHAGFDCKGGKFLSTIENSFIVSKADNFDMSERLENGYQWTEKHQNRSPIELKTSSVDMLFHNCQHIQPNLTLKLPKNYWSYGMIINMERWNLKFYT
jgi:2-polyprenyl-3-methyl-5-hydroxy-6-metoxy-1,4-benzoquinol methylase